ncbi:putative esterase [Rubrobacter radiotolerans]|uniref:Alpha/beta hydrolase n=1 Tax=Rubrobacter radiotolerans TaxID=42256 RepID=A0A023X1E2_RUBRA|nr:alpha/beta hydrolase [Rubrobacter radiotolerans]AHY46292.1 putative esterase [Rubrobacter radiotolerans]MDX5893700.1 alpha/beta hydrolase [Rubrobacter radiotolerans]SMC04304.1 phospholipase/carboxylesterase [Rubrobacter radiotolerans DSM 5868]
MSRENENPGGFIHRYVPGKDDTTLLVLHGTGGSEKDLIPLAKDLAPEANVLSPRGKVLEFGAPRFFRRLAEGVFDHEDLVARTHELADFVRWAADEYGFDAGKLVAVGYSNGANIAGSLMLLYPDLLSGAVLFRAMVPFEPEEDLPDLSGVSVLIAAGSVDQMIPQSQTERLAQILTESGADVDLRWKDTGHGLTYEEVAEAREWLADRSG